MLQNTPKDHKYSLSAQLNEIKGIQGYMCYIEIRNTDMCQLQTETFFFFLGMTFINQTGATWIPQGHPNRLGEKQEVIIQSDWR